MTPYDAADPNGWVRDRTAVAAFSGGTGEVVSHGHVIARYNVPTYVIELPDGSRMAWAANLVREATPDEVFRMPLPRRRRCRSYEEIVAEALGTDSDGSLIEDLVVAAGQARREAPRTVPPLSSTAVHMIVDRLIRLGWPPRRPIRMRILADRDAVTAIEDAVERAFPDELPPRDTEIRAWEPQS